MIWTPCDLKLMSCGIEGAIYEWDVANATRVGELITKSCRYSDICVTTDGKTSYCVGSDGYIREITFPPTGAQVHYG